MLVLRAALELTAMRVAVDHQRTPDSARSALFETTGAEVEDTFRPARPRPSVARVSNEQQRDQLTGAETGEGLLQLQRLVDRFVDELLDMIVSPHGPSA